MNLEEQKLAVCEKLPELKSRIATYRQAEIKNPLMQSECLSLKWMNHAIQAEANLKGTESAYIEARDRMMRAEAELTTLKAKAKQLTDAILIGGSRTYTMQVSDELKALL